MNPSGATAQAIARYVTSLRRPATACHRHSRTIARDTVTPSRGATRANIGVVRSQDDIVEAATLAEEWVTEDELEYERQQTAELEQLASQMRAQVRGILLYCQQRCDRDGCGDTGGGVTASRSRLTRQPACRRTSCLTCWKASWSWNTRTSTWQTKRTAFTKYVPALPLAGASTARHDASGLWLLRRVLMGASSWHACVAQDMKAERASLDQKLGEERARQKQLLAERLERKQAVLLKRRRKRLQHQLRAHTKRATTLKRLVKVQAAVAARRSASAGSVVRLKSAARGIRSRARALVAEKP